ncbi:tetratricopeptide repeat protein [Paenibacillus paeoniae]|uniref:DAC domain-containing protein n=1 Tax=Paenibacillus paeoniae TaxID=2292705 RepID=A0A371PIA3_9BACL|nr:diadenylate cyclase [Paenibacillus paeoniae]REK75110.1 hypothetical protein DX130_15880 [Paenibacillus paeoniae]
MKILEKNLEILNSLTYDNLTKTLKKLNKRIHIKLYALVYDNNQALVERIRIKKTVSNGENILSTSQDQLQTIMNVFAELKIDTADAGDTYESIKDYVNKVWYKQQLKSELIHSEVTSASTPADSKGQTLSVKNQVNDNRLLYVNQFPFHVNQTSYSVVYILEMRNIEHETRKLFYTKPEISFLRMALDYFFRDYFATTTNGVEINKDDTITRKYNEDSIQFNRRLTRLFFGKMQTLLQNNTKFDDFGDEFDNEQRNEYYVNSLLEKLDDISCLTYENASPFGSILFINKDIIAERTLIHFTITFTEEDRIRLEDAKRIRKLLELTNVDKDLYLIADENEIYGLGEVNWNMQRDALALRFDFTGLSKYNFVLVRTEAEPLSGGKLFIQNDKKYYRSDLNFVELKLVSVNFKDPRMGEEGYSAEKFTHLLKKTFWENDADDHQVNRKIERLEKIVSKAREQKHGTMVVITEESVAKQELKLLSKQSTLIEPEVINSEYIKFLTAIDGAIYFDTDGNCRAIGVILDGIAKEDVGDASRGARYNSAHRYLHKLKDDNEEEKKCVIVIISEDGMVDLIPESEHEDMLLAIAEYIIDTINEENPDSDKLEGKENFILNSKIVDCDWLFNIAEEYVNNGNYERAIDFFEYGRIRAENSYILPRNYYMLGDCYNGIEKYEDAIKIYETALKAEGNDKVKCNYMGRIGMSYRSHALQLNEENEFRKAIEWMSQGIELAKTCSYNSKAFYNNRGLCYMELSDLKKSQNKTNLLEQAIEEFNQSISIEHNNIYYWNRHLSYNRLGRAKESIEDLIQAEFIEHTDHYIENITVFLKKQPSIITEAIEFYKRLCEQEEGPPQLAELLNKYMAKSEATKQAEAAAGEESDVDKNKK